MKGKISLKDFIKEVKKDLRSAVDEKDPFFVMNEVNLEVSFGLEAEAGGSAKFVVFDLSSKAKLQQTHKVTINLTPFLSGDGGTDQRSGKPVYLTGVAPALKNRVPPGFGVRGPAVAKARAAKKVAKKKPAIRKKAKVAARKKGKKK